MPAYVVFLIRGSHNVEALQRYRQQAVPTITQHGGHVLVARGRQTPLEGAPPEETVMIEFPTHEQALAWYGSEAYQLAARLRHGAADVDAYVVEGRAAPSA